METLTQKLLAKPATPTVVAEAMQPKPTEPLVPGAREAEDLLFLAMVAQSIFWEAVSTLERHLGFEIDSSQDLAEVGIEDLKASRGAPV